jgi:hypothetical protein
MILSRALETDKGLEGLLRKLLGCRRSSYRTASFFI